MLYVRVVLGLGDGAGGGLGGGVGGGGVGIAAAAYPGRGSVVNLAHFDIRWGV